LLQCRSSPGKSTPPDANGQFELYLVPVEVYDVLVTSTGHPTAALTGAPVVSTAPAQVNDST